MDEMCSMSRGMGYSMCAVEPCCLVTPPICSEADKLVRNLTGNRRRGRGDGGVHLQREDEIARVRYGRFRYKAPVDVEYEEVFPKLSDSGRCRS
jgi:hypothetical protein